MTQPCFTTVSMVNSSDIKEGSDSERMMNENLPPEGLIEGDDWGDTLVSCEISSKFHGRLYACGVTGIHVNETSQMSCRDGHRDTRTASFLTKQVWVTQTILMSSTITIHQDCQSLSGL